MQKSPSQQCDGTVGALEGKLYCFLRAGKSKGFLFLPNHTGCLCKPGKVDLEGSPHSPLQRMEKDLLSLYDLLGHWQDKTG